MNIDLHRLANTPGAGIAKQQLQKAGFWSPENAAIEGQRMRFKFCVSGTYAPEVERAIVEVIASSKDEARDLAVELTDFDEIDDCTIIDVREVDA